MRFSSFIAASAAALVSAAPSPLATLSTGTSSVNWTVSDWEAGCSRGGCYYTFSVSAPAYNGLPAPAPAFNALCSGNEAAGYKACTFKDGAAPAGQTVVARLNKVKRADGTTTPAEFDVSFQFADANVAGTYYNWTASGVSTFNQFVSPPKTFTITPTKVFGIA